MLQRITFDKIARIGRKVVKCAGCGKRLQRQKQFWQTQNPFNVGADGLPKSRETIWAEIDRDIAAWRKLPEQCSQCKATF